MSNDPSAKQPKPEQGQAASQPGSRGLPAVTQGAQPLPGLTKQGARALPPLGGLGALPPLAAQASGPAHRAPAPHDTGEEEGEAVTTVVPEGDSAALFRTLARGHDAS